MNQTYQTTQQEIEIALRQGGLLLKVLPGLLRELKQAAKDLRVVEYDYHRGDGVSVREYKAIEKRYEKIAATFANSGVRSQCRLLREAFEHIEETSYLITEEIEKASPGRVARRYAAAPNLREILDDMNAFARRHGDRGRDRAEISKDGRILEVSFRTEYDEADYGQYEEPDFPNYAKKYHDQLTSTEKGFIKSISGDYGEKGWYYITVTLK